MKIEINLNGKMISIDAGEPPKDKEQKKAFYRSLVEQVYKTPILLKPDNKSGLKVNDKEIDLGEMKTGPEFINAFVKSQVDEILKPVKPSKEEIVQTAPINIEVPGDRPEKQFKEPVSRKRLVPDLGPIPV